MIELFSDDLSLFDYKTRGKRPIDVAAEYGNLIVIRHLLQIKPSETDSKEGVVALVQAAVRHHENEVLSFLKKRYENTLNRHLNTLHFACRQLHGDKMVSDLINPKSIMYQDKQSGFSPLMVAIQHRQLKCIKELLGHNDFTSEAFELTSFISFSTVLHICAKVNQKDITDAIFDCPYMSISLVVAADVQGDTPLHICAQVGNAYMTNRLLDYMSQTISPTVPLKRSDQKTRNTSSQSASLSNHVYKMVAKKNKSKLTPLHVAIHYGQVDIIKKMFEFLVHPSSMINEHDDQWRTSLHMAAEKG
jgi:ankyrin